MLVVVATPAQAQAGPRTLATRQELEALVASGHPGKGPLAQREREGILTRLNAGDFQPGDRLILRVVGDTSLTDTFTVRAGQEVPLPGLDPLPLKGVLRSELQQRMEQFLARYLRAPQVQTTSLIRLGLLGGVARPGYYSVAPDMPLGEVIPALGGIAPDGELKKASIVRNGKELWSREEVRQAMGRGSSLDQLGLQSGDEITVGRRSAGIGQPLAIVTGAVGLVATIVLITRN